MKTLLISAVAIGLMTGAACAAPALMTEAQMDQVVAGARADRGFDNPSGNLVWVWDYSCECVTNANAGESAHQFPSADPKDYFIGRGNHTGQYGHWTTEVIIP